MTPCAALLHIYRPSTSPFSTCTLRKTEMQPHAWERDDERCEESGGHWLVEPRRHMPSWAAPRQTYHAPHDHFERSWGVTHRLWFLHTNASGWVTATQEEKHWGTQVAVTAAFYRTGKQAATVATARRPHCDTATVLLFKKQGWGRMAALPLMHSALRVVWPVSPHCTELSSEAGTRLTRTPPPSAE